MQLLLKAEPGEILQKRRALLDALADQVAGADPELAEGLYRALPPPNTAAPEPALRHLQHNMRRAYQAEMERAVARVVEVLQDASRNNDEPIGQS